MVPESEMNEPQPEQQKWRQVNHNGLWQDVSGELQHSEFLEKMLRVLCRGSIEDGTYEEYAIGAGDVSKLRQHLNALEAERDRLRAALEQIRDIQASPRIEEIARAALHPASKEKET